MCHSFYTSDFLKDLNFSLLNYPKFFKWNFENRKFWWFPILNSVRSRTSKEMDRTLYADFAKFKTTRDFLTKISAILQIWKIWFLTKFEGCSSKIVPATPIGSFLRFWREIQILSTYDLDFLCKAGFHRGLQLVKIWCWHLNPLVRNSKLTILSFQFASN